MAKQFDFTYGIEAKIKKWPDVTMPDRWFVPLAKELDGDEGIVVWHRLPLPDFFWVNGIRHICISERAGSVLKPLNIPDVEILPITVFLEVKRELRALKDRFFVLHFLAAVDCLDYEKSNFVRYRGGAIKFISKIVLNEQIVEERKFFEFGGRGLPSLVVANDDVASHLKYSGLTGFNIVDISEATAGIPPSD